MNPSSPSEDMIDSGRARLFGLLLSWGLYGLLISQTFTYFMTFPHDAKIHKFVAFSVFSLETLQTVLMTHDGYQIFVLNPRDVDSLEDIGFIWLAVPVLCGTVGWIAALFYANRIYKISGSRRVSGAIIALSFVQLATAIAEGARSHSAQNLVALREPTLKTVTPLVWTASMTICDVIIAVTMTYYLVRLRREFHQSSHLIRKLMTLTVETGMATALTAMSAGILFIAWPDSETFTIPGLILGKLYSNSLLRVLNSRNRAEYTGDIVTLPLSFGSSPAPRQQP